LILLGGDALTMLGVGFVLPILPLLISRRGGSPLFVGVVFASGVAVRALAQYPAGWLADRWGHRPVIVASLLVYGLGFPLYAVRMPFALLLVLRCVQAIGGGSYYPAAAAVLGGLVDDERRGRAFAQLRAADMFGLLAGPAVGGLVAGYSLDAVFVVAGVVCLVAAGLMLLLPRRPRLVAASAAARGPQGGALGVARVLIPVMALGIPISWWSGTFDSVWSLYLTGRGAAPGMVGLSFAVFAVPVVLLSSTAGRVADRAGYAVASSVAVLTYGVAASAYSATTSVPLLISMLLIEGTLSAAGSPALAAEVCRNARPGVEARTQAVYQTVLLLAQVAGSVGGGALYERRPTDAFLATTVVCVAGVVVSAAVRRARVGRTLPADAVPALAA
jgi:MFS family permease